MKKSGLMKKVVVLGLTVAMALGTMVTGNAAGKVWKFSFNPNCTEEGWVTCPTQVYDASVGYGFTEANTFNSWGANYEATASTALPEGTMVGVKVPEDAAGQSLYNAVCGYAAAPYKGAPEMSFFVDLPAGTYNVTVYSGGASQNETYDFNHIYVNGEEIVRDFETDPWNADKKSGKASALEIKNLEWNKTITLTAATKLEIKASNPADQTRSWFGAEKTAGGRAYLNGVVIEEVVASTGSDNVPKTGVVSVAAICGVVALASAGVAVVTRKKED